ncbi:DUF294 nucleotidyltransferase-like domain-containing protein [Ornithinimicrobium sp. W1679]|uniref:DUF294 nucleotidyltransferase-like domain-containing protein n=1 Tax=unclassified Ornithinimicrobium TaxID=2615080 RepID=UPI003CF1E022
MDVELAEVRDFLAQHPPFDALPPEVLDRLPARCTLRYARRGSVILHAGGRGDRLWVVRSGAVDITDEGRLVDRLGAGGCFGMSALVEHGPIRYDATAREDSLLITLPQADFDELAQEHPAVAVHFAATHHGRIRTALSQLQQPRTGSAVFRTAVRDLVRGEPVATGPQVSVAEAARRMTEAGVSSILVMEGDRLVGILTDRDLRRRVVAAGTPTDRPVREVMTLNPVTISSDALALEVMLEMTGRNIHHLPVVDAEERVVGLVTTTDLVRLERSNPVYLVTDLAKAPDVGAVVGLAARIPRIVEQLVSEDATAADVGRVATALTDAVTVRVLELAQAELGPAPAPWAWVALGSAAREELTLRGDQDHAMVLGEEADPQDPWWAAVADRVTDALEACGLERCDGDVMATNPRWRKRVPEWRAQFARWAHEPQPEAVLWAAIFYDMRPVHGDADLVAGLREQVVRMGSRSDLLLAHLAGQAARMRPPIGFFRGFVLEDAGEHRDTLDIKRGISAIVQLARIHSLRAGATALPTGARLAAARARGVLAAESAVDLADAHELMSYLRLQHQVAQVRDGRRPDNHLDPELLSSLDRRHLRDAFQIVRQAQHGLSTRLPQVT